MSWPVRWPGPSFLEEVECRFGRVPCKWKGSKPEPRQPLRDAVGEGCGKQLLQLVCAC